MIPLALGCRIEHVPDDQPLSHINSLFDSEAVAQRCSVKKVFLKISQNSQESTCARVSFLIKLQAQSATLLKKSHIVCEILIWVEAKRNN